MNFLNIGMSAFLRLGIYLFIYLPVLVSLIAICGVRNKHIGNLRHCHCGYTAVFSEHQHSCFSYNILVIN